MVPTGAPYKYQFKTWNHVLHDGPLNLFDYILFLVTDGGLKLKKDHDYYHQIQGQLFISNKLCCDLCVWTSVNFEVIRICRDNSWTPNIAKLIDFYFNKFVPSLSTWIMDCKHGKGLSQVYNFSMCIDDAVAHLDWCVREVMSYVALFTACNIKKVNLCSLNLDLCDYQRSNLISSLESSQISEIYLLLMSCILFSNSCLPWFDHSWF